MLMIDRASCRLGAIIARDRGPVAGILGVAWHQQWRPIGGALAIAARFGEHRIAIPGVERHGFDVDLYLTFRGVRGLCGLGGLGKHECRAKWQQGGGDHGSEDLLHDEPPKFFLGRAPQRCPGDFPAPHTYRATKSLCCKAGTYGQRCALRMD